MNRRTGTLLVDALLWYGLLLAQLAANLVALDRDVLDVVGFDLVEEPGVIVDRGLGLRHELPEDDREPADQKQPEPRRGRRPAGTVALSCSG